MNSVFKSRIALGSSLSPYPRDIGKASFQTQKKTLYSKYSRGVTIVLYFGLTLPGIAQGRGHRVEFCTVLA